MTDQTVAKTILAQLGGNKFFAMTGASNLLSRPDGISFKVGSNPSGTTHVRVTLTSADEYDMEFLKIRGTKVQTVDAKSSLGAENLATIFECVTGLAVHLCGIR